MGSLKYALQAYLEAQLVGLAVGLEEICLEQLEFLRGGVNFTSLANSTCFYRLVKRLTRGHLLEAESSKLSVQNMD